MVLPIDMQPLGGPRDWLQWRRSVERGLARLDARIAALGVGGAGAVAAPVTAATQEASATVYGSGGGYWEVKMFRYGGVVELNSSMFDVPAAAATAGVAIPSGFRPRSTTDEAPFWAWHYPSDRAIRLVMKHDGTLAYAGLGDGGTALTLLSSSARTVFLTGDPFPA